MNRSAVGRSADSFEMPIERSKIRELAVATGSDNDAYLGLDPCVPATFFTTMFGWMGPEHNPWSFLDINPLNSVQASQEYEFFGPVPRAGMTLYGQSHVEAIYEKTSQRGTATLNAVVRTEFRDGTGELQVISRLVVSEFGTQFRSTRARDRRRDGSPAVDRAAIQPEREIVVGPGASTPNLGWPVRAPDPREIGPLSLLDFVRYEGATAHFNPVHFDHEIARRAGCDKPFAVGMLLAGYLATWATDWLGPRNVRRIWFEFRRRVWLGDTIVVSGGLLGSDELFAQRRSAGTEILDPTTPSAGEPVVGVGLACQNAEGVLAVAGGATFVAR